MPIGRESCQAEMGPESESLSVPSHRTVPFLEMGVQKQ